MARVMTRLMRLLKTQLLLFSLVGATQSSAGSFEGLKSFCRRVVSAAKDAWTQVPVHTQHLEAVNSFQSLEEAFPTLIKHYYFARAFRMNQSAHAFKLVRDADGLVVAENSFRGEDNVYPASSIKTLVGIALLKKVDKGELSLDAIIKVDQPNALEESVALRNYSFVQGKEVSVRELLEAMIVVSDNIATNQIVDLVGRDEVNALAEEIGAGGLKFVRKLYDQHPAEPWIEERNSGNAESLLASYLAIAHPRTSILSEDSQELLMSYLRSNRREMDGMVPKASYVLYNKTGATSDSSSDAGFMRLPGGYTLYFAGLQDYNTGYSGLNLQFIVNDLRLMALQAIEHEP